MRTASTPRRRHVGLEARTLHIDVEDRIIYCLKTERSPCSSVVSSRRTYDGSTQTLRIEVGNIDATHHVALPVEKTENAHRVDRLYRFLDRAEIAYDLKDRLYRMSAAKTRLEAWLFDIHALELERDLQDALLELLLD